VAAEDCTGCGLCVEVCPAKNKAEPSLKAINMEAQLPIREQERENWDFFLKLPNPDRSKLNLHKISHQQMQEPLFEFSGSLCGLWRNPLHQAGDPAVWRSHAYRQRHWLFLHLRRQPAHHPLHHNTEGRGPAWSNSLFEDNAEFGLGFRVSVDKQSSQAVELLQHLAL
jgi:pyruvate-ferredoxin/flavodoxin oxidoreductase